MSSSLPPEMLDLIIDHLHDDPTTLKTCCTVSKSWIPRTRNHLFARVTFDTTEFRIEMWKKAFPDPSNSPAHHTRSLSIHAVPVIAATDIRTFHNVVHLQLWGMDRTSFPFYGFSPAIKSLSLIHVPPSSLDLICSFSFLEDLALVAFFPTEDEDGWNAPLTSPKLTETLDLAMLGKASAVIRRLLVLPSGLHFSKIAVLLSNEDAKSVTDLVSKCSGTLESLTLRFYPESAFPSAL